MRPFWFFLLLLLAVSCARIGSPVGGPKDVTPPKFLGASVDSPYVNVPRDLRELRLKFDEYVMLKDINRSLIISPPLKQITRILPAGIATREVIIQWKDTLKANTTYSFNFGNAIRDNHEENVLPYFNFALSTGPELTDLYISGTVTDATALPGVKVSSEKMHTVVGAYAVKDSMDYRQKPDYISMVDPDGYFELNYLAPGRYRVLAFDDENANSVYDSGKESVAFLPQPVVVEQSVSGLKLKLFPSQKRLRFNEAKEIPGGALFLFEGNPAQITFENSNQPPVAFQTSRGKNSDSLFVYFDKSQPAFQTKNPVNLTIDFNADGTAGKASLFYRNSGPQEMTLSGPNDKMATPAGVFKISSNYAVSQINTDAWALREDSLTVKPFSAEISPTDKQTILIKADFLQGKKYRLTLPKNTVSSFYTQVDKEYRWDFGVGNIENFGSLTLNLTGLPAGTKYWLQLMNPEGKILEQQYSDARNIKYPYLATGEYMVRLLVDENGDGRWAPASFADGRAAEPIYVFGKRINIRPLWELVEDWNVAEPENAENPATPETKIITPAPDKK